MSALLARIVAASAVRWSFVHGGPNVARRPRSTSSARSPKMLAAALSASFAL
jgi:hypothetical protein